MNFESQKDKKTTKTIYIYKYYIYIINFGSGINKVEITL